MLTDKLLAISVESFEDERAQEAFTSTAGERIFGRFASQVMRVYRQHLPGISTGVIFIAGIDPGFLVAVASDPEIRLRDLPKIQRSHAALLTHAESGGISLRQEIKQHIPTVSLSESTIAIRLVGFGEYYGLMFLHSNTAGYFSSEILESIRNSLAVLNRILAEEIFSMRLATLAAPFEYNAGGVTKDQTYPIVVRQACKGFAVDGAVVRITKLSEADPLGYILEFKERFGLVSDEQLTADACGEKICRTVFESAEGITVQGIRSDGTRVSFGIEIPDNEDATLRSFGIQAYMIQRLESDLSDAGIPTRMGTLSIFHRVPQLFSRRDVSLFRSFCERIADDLALMEQRDDKDALYAVLKVQNSLGQRAEITALLGHDFGHRVFDLSEELDNFVRVTTKQFKDRSLPRTVELEAEKLRKSGEQLKDIVRQLRLLGQGVEDAPLLFDLGDEKKAKGEESSTGVFAEIGKTLLTVLDRNNMGFDYRTEGNCRIFGIRGILVQVLYNLAINSVDAHKQTGIRRKNTIHFAAREVGEGLHRKVEVTIWDEGPGISRSAFPDAKRIFDVGSTSKPRGLGTGTGLPVARSLLGRYFGADLELVDRSRALFRFVIPSRIEGR